MIIIYFSISNHCVDLHEHHRCRQTRTNKTIHRGTKHVCIRISLGPTHKYINCLASLLNENWICAYAFAPDKTTACTVTSSAPTNTSANTNMRTSSTFIWYILLPILHGLKRTRCVSCTARPFIRTYLFALEGVERVRDTMSAKLPTHKTIEALALWHGTVYILIYSIIIRMNGGARDASQMAYCIHSEDARHQLDSN